MWQSLKRLFGLLTTRQRWQGLLLVVLLIGNALLEMVGVGLVPLYIGILAEPEQLLQRPRVTQATGLLGLGPEQLTQRTLLYGGSALLLGIFTLKLLYAPLVAYARARFVQGVVQAQGIRLFNGYMGAPYEFHLRRHSAELIRNVTGECTRLGEVVLSPLVSLGTQLLVTLAIVGLLVIATPGTVLLTLLGFGLIAVPLVALLSRRIKRLSLAAHQGRKRVIRSVQEGLGGVKELRLLRRETYFVTRFKTALKQVLDLQRFLQVQSVGLPVFMEWISVAALLLVIIILYRSEQSPENLLGVVALFAVAMARLKGSVTGLLGSFTQVRAGLVSVDVVDHDLRHLDRIQPRLPLPAMWQEGSALQLARGMQLDDVWFRYAGSADPVLRGISLTVQKGEAVGFVGPSGGGKSTLVDLILGILVPEQGTIKVDGMDIRHDLPAWHRTVGYIPQSIYLIDGTIRQNIALGLEEKEIDNAAVARAMSAASLDEFVASLPDGANTLIGERGVCLSGGQRQRIAIARALYHDPDVLIMDEATSALDNLTEQAVMEAVDALKGERTILMIAHRLSTVRNCDRIVFLTAGQISGIGSYDELAASHRDFKRLARAS